MALPREELELTLFYYNANTMWVRIDRILEVFGLTRGDLADTAKTAARIRATAARMPTYVALKEVKSGGEKAGRTSTRWLQFEKLWAT